MIVFSHLDKNRNLVKGQVFEPLEFCISNYNSGKCKAFYDDILGKNKTGFFQCPYGLCAYSILYNKKNYIFTSIKEKNTYNKRKLDLRITQKDKQKFFPTLSQEYISSIVSKIIDEVDIESSLRQRTEFMENFSHDVKKLNARIKEISDYLLSDFLTEDEKISLDEADIHKIQTSIKNIYIASGIFSSRLQLFEEEQNQLVLSKNKFKCNPYQKFDKIRKIFINYANKRIRINLKGQCYRVFPADTTFEFIPLLIVDNAIKYSENDGEVNIYFEEINDEIIIKIESLGPFLEQNEMDKIFNKGYRGKNAKITSDGSGIGLYFVKLICDKHNIEIPAISDSKRRVQVGALKYAPFIVTLKIRNTEPLPNIGN